MDNKDVGRPSSNDGPLAYKENEQLTRAILEQTETSKNILDILGNILAILENILDLLDNRLPLGTNPNSLEAAGKKRGGRHPAPHETLQWLALGAMANRLGMSIDAVYEEMREEGKRAGIKPPAADTLKKRRRAALRLVP
jgi:hypothetical protein